MAILFSPLACRDAARHVSTVRRWQCYARKLRFVERTHRTPWRCKGMMSLPGFHSLEEPVGEPAAHVPFQRQGKQGESPYHDDHQGRHASRRVSHSGAWRRDRQVVHSCRDRCFVCVKRRKDKHSSRGKRKILEKPPVIYSRFRSNCVILQPKRKIKLHRV